MAERSRRLPMPTPVSMPMRAEELSPLAVLSGVEVIAGGDGESPGVAVPV
jgi:hypothetical protein